MGLFNFLNSKERPPASEAAANVVQPRCCHYTLTHVALRSIALEWKMKFLAVLGGPSARQFLADMLARVAEQCKPRESACDFSADEIVVHCFRLGPHPCAVLQMPPPRAVTEAFFVAAVVMADADGTVPDGANLRYFTLEKGFALDGPPRTVLGEWTGEGSHLNFGDGPEADVNSFALALKKMLAATGAAGGLVGEG